MGQVGRPKGSGGTRMADAHRDKIRNSNILSALVAHAEGKREMSSTQVTAGLGLLKKVMPDMTESMHKGEGANGEIVHSLTIKFG